MQLFHAVQVVIVLGVLVGTELAGAQNNPEVSLPLPAEVSIQSATAQQLGAAVGKAVQENPTQAAAIAAQAIGGLTSDETGKAAAVMTAALAAGPGSDVLAVVRAAAAANPALAATVAATAARLFPRLAGAISRAAVEGDPNQAREIALAVAAIVPDQRDVIFASIRSLSLPRLDLGALGFAMGQGINPANTVGGPGSSIGGDGGAAATEPSQAAGPGPTPGPGPVSSPPPLLGGEVISPES